MFTKQQYEAIAKVLSKYSDSISRPINKRILVLELQQMFEQDNWKFKGHLWREACRKQ